MEEPSGRALSGASAVAACRCLPPAPRRVLDTTQGTPLRTLYGPRHGLLETGRRIGGRGDLPVAFEPTVAWKAVRSLGFSAMGGIAARLPAVPERNPHLDLGIVRRGKLSAPHRHLMIGPRVLRLKTHRPPAASGRRPVCVAVGSAYFTRGQAMRSAMGIRGDPS